MIGPLYNIEFDNKLIKYINQYNFIKKVVASEIAYINAAFEMGHDISPKEIAVFPSGIISSNELEENISKKISSRNVSYILKKDLKNI